VAGVDQSNLMNNPRARRSPVLLTASVEGVAGPIDVKLRNLSEDGALIEGEDLPEEGSTTVFERNGLRVKCTVAWVQGRYAGVAFARPLKAQEVLRHIPTPNAKPKVELGAGRPGLACRPLTAYERKMLETWMAASPYTVGD
jgi:hypothetical protein